MHADSVARRGRAAAPARPESPPGRAPPRGGRRRSARRRTRRWPRPPATRASMTVRTCDRRVVVGAATRSRPARAASGASRGPAPGGRARTARSAGPPTATRRRSGSTTSSAPQAMSAWAASGCLGGRRVEPGATVAAAGPSAGPHGAGDRRASRSRQRRSRATCGLVEVGERGAPLAPLGAGTAPRPGAPPASAVGCRSRASPVGQHGRHPARGRRPVCRWPRRPGRRRRRPRRPSSRRRGPRRGCASAATAASKRPPSTSSSAPRRRARRRTRGRPRRSRPRPASAAAAVRGALVGAERPAVGQVEQVAVQAAGPAASPARARGRAARRGAPGAGRRRRGRPRGRPRPRPPAPASASPRPRRPGRRRADRAIGPASSSIAASHRSAARRPTSGQSPARRA